MTPKRIHRIDVKRRRRANLGDAGRRWRDALRSSPQLACRLPARVHGYPWRLAYSTVRHGTSLKTLYRNLLHVDGPVLLVIKDVENQVGGINQINQSINQ